MASGFCTGICSALKASDVEELMRCSDQTVKAELDNFHYLTRLFVPIKYSENPFGILHQRILQESPFPRP